jgi:hypothetical protein
LEGRRGFDIGVLGAGSKYPDRESLALLRRGFLGKN